MVKPLLKFTLLASCLLLSTVSCRAAPDAAEPLSHKQLQNPETVRQWMNKHADKKVDDKAMSFYKQDLEYKNRQYWSGAAKAFGESAIYYPKADTLYYMISAELKMYAEIRSRSVPSAKKDKLILQYARAIYQSVLASDAVNKSLTGQQANTVQNNIKCLDQYLKTGKPIAGCDPLVEYGILK